MTTKPRVVDAADAYWVDVALHDPQDLPPPLILALHAKYPWLTNILCACPYCRATRTEANHHA